jgi:hypothetical protein
MAQFLSALSLSSKHVSLCVILLNVKRCYIKLLIFDCLGLQFCFYSNCIYVFPDYSDDFCITLTDFQVLSQSQ